jgi:hypothetical protein
MLKMAVQQQTRQTPGGLPKRRTNQPAAMVLAGICLFVLLASCSRRNSDEASNAIVDLSNGVFIVNQGAYLSTPAGTPTGSISFFGRGSGQLTNDLFGNANSGRALGDNVTHMARVGARFYMCVATTNRMEIVDTRLFQSIGTITNLNVPSFCLALDTTKAYVTEYVSLTSGTNGTVAIVNLTNRSVVGRIATGPFPRKMVRVGNSVYVQYSTSAGMPNLTVINTANDQAVNTLSTNLAGAVDMIDGGNNTLWVALQGMPNRVVRVNVNTGVIDLSIPVAGALPLRVNALALNDAGTVLYVITSAGLQAITLATQQVQTISPRAFFSVGFDALGRVLYCGTDFGTARASVLRYTPANNFQDSLRVGVRPGLFVF